MHVLKFNIHECLKLKNFSTPAGQVHQARVRPGFDLHHQSHHGTLPYTLYIVRVIKKKSLVPRGPDPYDERFGRVWRGSYSFALGGFWWSRTLRGLRNVLVWPVYSRTSILKDICLRHARDAPAGRRCVAMGPYSGGAASTRGPIPTVGA